MLHAHLHPTRRTFLRHLTLGTAAAFTVPGLFAEELSLTPKQTEGPFYPDHLPLDTDNDLLILNDAITPAVGEVSYVSGRILDARGEPLRGAVVEIWQCDNHGAYLHSGTSNKEKRDQNFQGFGRFLTGATGEYLFRTIKPVAYPGRTPHIHYKVKARGKELLTTQCYVKGHAGNERDGIWKRMGEKDRELVTVDFAAMPGAKAGELAARFDVVVGVTPEA
ncbi:MAG TPA: protocatechuate 3,4-dioxygenase [Chthoniobacteraceae bacterium]|jgi:protocatechuate 3,4-dioxygenase beta subunit|nr:protocatechuate 3,4-dioxygenase beta subunit [Chthoniobacter sp.]HEV7867766.1 protocatechuate 3,4-dioxygenase [Chthoniobacteraceae bacterium]